MCIKKIFLLFTLLFFSTLVYSKENILWYYPDFPPSHIVDGEFKGKGTVDHVHKKLFPYLENYNHRVSIANFERIIKNIANKQQTCGSALLKNPNREKVVLYSEAYLVIHPVRLIINEKDFEKFELYKEGDGTYSLEKILLDEKLTLGYSLGRSYSKVLDEIILRNANKKNSFQTSQAGILRGLLKMLSKKRVDYTLGYTIEANYFSREMNLKDTFLSLPIHGANELIPVYVGCPKNSWGEEIIKKLNPYLLKFRESSEFYEGYLMWLDENAKKDYPQLVKEYFTQ